jgi:hypothetical protein
VPERIHMADTVAGIAEIFPVLSGKCSHKDSTGRPNVGACAGCLFLAQRPLRSDIDSGIAPRP